MIGYGGSEFNEILLAIIWEAAEGTSQLKTLRWILLEYQVVLDNQLLAEAMIRIRSVKLAAALTSFENQSRRLGMTTLV